jgi:hypothetical protein
MQVTSSYVSIQKRLSSMLVEIADSLGRMQMFKELYPTEHMKCTTATLYAEIVNLLRSMISFWHKRRFGECGRPNISPRYLTRRISLY